MALFEALYGRRCWSQVARFEVGEPLLIGPEIVYESLDRVHVDKE